MSKLNRRVLVIGHRGVGKSLFLKRLAKSCPEGLFVDLDVLIEERWNVSCSKFFELYGEKAFREVENQTFLDFWEAHQETPELVVAVGAGFSGSIPKEFEVLHLRRDSDEKGRVFLDRPRLETSLSPLEEYQLRFKKRRLDYEMKRDRVWTMPEGAFYASNIERDFFSKQLRSIGGALTLMPEFLKRRNWERDLASLLEQGLSLVELRNDILNGEQIHKAVQWIPFEKRLFSYRPQPLGDFSDLSAKWIDWDLELGECRDRRANILSYHSRDTEIGQTLRKLDPYVGKSLYLKFAPKIQDFFELEKVHRWSQHHAPKVLFFPRSAFESSLSKRWQWYRLLHKGQFLNFWREAEGPSADQPSLAQWLATPNAPRVFAAVLGSPVSESFSPEWHREYFALQGVPFFSVDISKDEFSLELLLFLKELGLRWAAVTSPLKELVFDLELPKDSNAQALRSVNTLVWSEAFQGFSAHNTDLYGFASLVEDLSREDVVVWGGGGVLSTVKSIFPRAAHYSSREGALLSGIPCSPKTLIWAAGPTAKVPHQSWHPEWVVDLSYSEASNARAYAQSLGARYRSGLKMFARQASRQRQHWKTFQV